MLRFRPIVCLLLALAVSTVADGRPRKKKNAPEPQIRCDAVHLDGERLYVGSTGGVTWFDISEPTTPVSLDQFFMREAVWDISVHGRYAMLAVGTRGLYALDFEHEDGIQVISRHEVPGNTRQLVWNDEFVFLAAGRHGVEIVSTRYPDRLQRAAHIAARDKVRAIAIQDERLAVLDSGYGLLVYDISRPNAPREILARRLDLTLWDVAFHGDTYYLAAGDRGLLPLRQQAGKLLQLPFIPTAIRAYHARVGDETLVVTDGRSSMELFEFAENNLVSRGTEWVHRSAQTGASAIRNDLLVIAGGPQCFTLYGIGNPAEPERYTGQSRKMNVTFP